MGSPSQAAAAKERQLLLNIGDALAEMLEEARSHELPIAWFRAFPVHGAAPNSSTCS